MPRLIDVDEVGEVQACLKCFHAREAKDSRLLCDLERGRGHGCYDTERGRGLCFCEGLVYEGNPLCLEDDLVDDIRTGCIHLKQTVSRATTEISFYIHSSLAKDGISLSSPRSVLNSLTRSLFPV